VSGRPFRIGLNLPYVEGQAGGATPRWGDILAMAQAAEELGFDEVWVSDHVGFRADDGTWRGAWDSWTLLSALAVATPRLGLGTYVSCAAFRNPALLAKMAQAGTSPSSEPSTFPSTTASTGSTTRSASSAPCSATAGRTTRAASSAREEPSCGHAAPGCMARR